MHTCHSPHRENDLQESVLLPWVPEIKSRFPLSQVTQVLIQMHEAAAWGGLSLSLRQALWGLDQDAELFPDCLGPSERSAV